MAHAAYNAVQFKADLYNRIPGGLEFQLLRADTTVGDIPLSLWEWDSASSANDDFDGGVIKPTMQSGNGRYLRRGYYSVQSNWDETDSASPAYILNKPTVPQAASQSSATPALDTSAQIHATRNCIVSYPVSISVTSTLLGTNSGSVFLEISPDNSAWTGIAQVGNSVAGVVSTTIGTHVLTGMVPANYYRRLRTATAGTNGATITSLQG